MPWDATSFWLAPVTPDGELGSATVVAGGKDESILQRRSGRPTASFTLRPTATVGGICTARQERRPNRSTAKMPSSPFRTWTFGSRLFAFLDDGRIVAIPVMPTGERLVVIEHGKASEVPTPFASHQSTLAVHGTRVFLVASGSDVATTVVAIDIDSGKLETLRSPGRTADRQGVVTASPNTITFDTPGRTGAWSTVLSPGQPRLHRNRG